MCGVYHCDGLSAKGLRWLFDVFLDFVLFAFTAYFYLGFAGLAPQCQKNNSHKSQTTKQVCIPAHEHDNETKVITRLEESRNKFVQHILMLHPYLG